MIVSVADTHAVVWYLFNDPRLSAAARKFIEQAVKGGNQVGVSSISIAEMVYLSEKGKIQQSAVEDLVNALADPDNVLTELPVTAAVDRDMQAVPRKDVPDMPDRIVAATSLGFGVLLISRDAKIQATTLQTIW
jgi:PIN domain nuclease of toxin-antitoxin system